MVGNQEFLQTLFGDDYIWAHVTAFPDDPSNIANENRMRCWAGDYFSRYNIPSNTNQYFTISTFYADDNNRARRRKALFRCTHVIVADDVREKLDIKEVEKLPQPTYKLQTSIGSEQWGWVLDTPCQDRGKVENLLDGLVAKGLAPDGKDPGMKGVTRYVRLPEGVNSKASKLVSGTAQRCVVLDWEPDNRVSIESLALPFSIDLAVERRDSRTDGASAVADHPLLKIPEIITVKDILSDGRYNITCPWVSEHTGSVDDGAAVFTNNDGSIGFKCHHGACQERTGKDLLNLIEEHQPGFTKGLETWKVMRVFDTMLPATNQAGPPVTLDFMGKLQSSEVPAIIPEPDNLIGYQDLVNVLKAIPHTEEKAITAAHTILQAVDSLDHGSRLNWWKQVSDHMDWNKQDLQAVIEQQRKVWYRKDDLDTDFYKDNVYVSEQNQFFNVKKGMWLTPEAFQNTYAHLDETARTEAITNGMVDKVDKVDYAPGMPQIYSENNCTYVNGWIDDLERGIPGDVDRWLNHFDALGWQDHKEHILQWMAFTLRHPEKKINHILLFGGGEGNGKDYLLYPLIKAMGRNSTTVDGDVLTEGFHDHLLNTKYLHINEVEMGDRKESKIVTNKLKPLASAPPYELRVNIKGVKPIKVRNIVNVSMTSNSALPLNLNTDARRYYAVWTDVTIRGVDGQVTKEWQIYWDDRWQWMRDCEGWKACVYYLMNNVDLSQFDPGRVPLLTDFVRDIQAASEDPLLSMIKEFVEKGLSLCKSDIVTSADIRSSLNTAAMCGVSVELRTIPSAQVIGKVMRQANLGVNSRAWMGKNEVRVWLIRNAEKYKQLSGSKLYIEYQRQMNQVKTNVPMIKVG